MPYLLLFPVDGIALHMGTTTSFVCAALLTLEWAWVSVWDNGWFFFQAI